MRLKMQCCVAFCEEASLPSGVLGPRDLAPLARADSDLREVVILRVAYERVGGFVVSSGEEVIGTGGVIVGNRKTLRSLEWDEFVSTQMQILI